MRSLMTKLVIVAALLVGTTAVAVGPVLADGNLGPLYATDGRYNPQIGDRLALYLSDSGIVVWGIDSSNNGLPLTSFTAAELASGKTIVHSTSQGTVTLRKTANAVTQTDWANYDFTSMTTFVVTPATYSISWSGGAYGANGAGGFVKFVQADY